MCLYLRKDFDGTIAQTFEPSPNGVGVNEACIAAILVLFGEKGVACFHRLNGLRNRSPRELIELMLKSEERPYFIQSAFDYFRKHRHSLEQFVPKDKGYPLVWSRRNPVSVISEIFVRIKLSLLIDEIGTKFPNGDKWPRPCKGALKFFKAIQRENQRVPNSVHTAIVSSGHDLFIQKVFEMWGIECPALLLTDDTMRRKQFDEEGDPAKYMKPSPYLLEIVDAQCVKAYPSVFSAKEEMIYFGDDLIKDGNLAKNYGIPFGYFDPSVPAFTKTASGFTFSDWSEIINPILTQKKKILA
jgi:hypothetical protein